MHSTLFENCGWGRNGAGRGEGGLEQGQINGSDRQPDFDDNLYNMGQLGKKILQYKKNPKQL